MAMQLVAMTLKRVFIMKDKNTIIELADPERSMNPKAVLNFYSNTYPILTTAKVSEGKLNNDRIEFTFDSVMGVKG